MLTIAIETVTLREPGPRMATTTIASRIGGKASTMSVSRISAVLSRLLSKNPAHRPSGKPIRAAIPTDRPATASEVRPPKIVRLRMSRPNWSVPKGWASDGG
jgi:hypothetical protein